MNISPEVFVAVGARKGRTIPTQTILKIYNVPDPDDINAVAFAKMGFCKQLQAWLRNDGQMANCAVRKEGVRWLTDAEALWHNRKRRLSGRRKIHNADTGLQNVSTESLTQEEKVALEKEQRIASAQLLAIRRASALEILDRM